MDLSRAKGGNIVTGDGGGSIGRIKVERTLRMKKIEDDRVEKAEPMWSQTSKILITEVFVGKKWVLRSKPPRVGEGA